MKEKICFVFTLAMLSLALVASGANPIVKRYKWRDKNGVEWTWEVMIPWELYWDCKSRPRIYSDYVPYVTDRSNFYLLMSLVHGLLSTAPYDRKGRLEFVVAFVQGAIPYVEDKYGERPKYPVETLVEGGDCEDKAILLAAFLRAIGYRVALLEFSEHVAVGVECPTCWGTYYLVDGVKYFYVEATAPGWLVGEVPPDFCGEPAYVVVVR